MCNMLNINSGISFTPNNNTKTFMGFTFILYIISSFKISDEPNQHIFGTVGVTRRPGGNPHRHGENMQTPPRHQQCSFCEATELTPAPPCQPKLHSEPMSSFLPVSSVVQNLLLGSFGLRFYDSISCKRSFIGMAVDLFW